MNAIKNRVRVKYDSKKKVLSVNAGDLTCRADWRYYRLGREEFSGKLFVHAIAGLAEKRWFNRDFKEDIKAIYERETGRNGEALLFRYGLEWHEVNKLITRMIMTN